MKHLKEYDKKIKSKLVGLLFVFIMYVTSVIHEGLPISLQWHKAQQIYARLINALPTLSKIILSYFQLDTQDHISMKLHLKFRSHEPALKMSFEK